MVSRGEWRVARDEERSERGPRWSVESRRKDSSKMEMDGTLIPDGRRFPSYIGDGFVDVQSIPA